MAAAGIPVQTTEDVVGRAWGKLFVNVGINALSAIHGRRNGQLLTSCAIRSRMKAAVREAEAVAQACGHVVTEDPVEAVFRVCRRTRRNVSSMLQDVRAGRRTEIDAINGFVVAQGERYGVDTPVNRELVRQIHQLESGAAR